MAIKYCDHGAYGSYVATPTWGIPQDGDGLSQAASTASAIASIVFSGVPSGTISVCGVTVSPTWGASADAAANALATAINAATGSVTTTGFRASSVQLRNAVFARGPSGGAPAGTCQIMTRHGSALFNGQVAIAHTLTNVNAGSSALTFSGGVSGCWGTLVNNTTMWPSSIAVATYGLLCTSVPFSGSIDPGDVVEIRANKTISFTTTSLTMVLPSVGSSVAPVTYRIDDATVWATDPANPKITLATSNAAGNTFSIQGNKDAFLHILGQRYADGSTSIDITATGSNTASPILRYGGPTVFEAVAFRCLTAGGAAQLTQLNNLVNGARYTTLNDCDFERNNSTAAWLTLGTAGNPGMLIMNGGNVRAVGQASPVTSGLVSLASNNTQNVRAQLNGVKFDGFVTGTRLFPTASAWNAGDAGLSALNCDWGSVNALGPNFLTTTFSDQVSEMEPGARGLFISSAYDKQEFVYERPGKCYVEWNADKGRPTLNARLLDGVTPWSIFAVPTSVAGNVSRTAPATIPAINKRVPDSTDLAEGVRTFTVNFLIESNLSAWTRADVSAVATYQDTSGAIRSVSSYSEDAAALDTSTALWTATDWNGQTWLKRAFTFATPYAVKAGSNVGIVVRLHTVSASEAQGIILDPEVLIT